MLVSWFSNTNKQTIVLFYCYYFVAMSTVGDVEILFLDEPTTGLDPLSRRNVWNAINWMKTDRVVVLTTHNMEEADFLGDNIMIMHNGQGKLNID